MSWNASGTVDSAEAVDKLVLQDYGDKSDEVRSAFKAAVEAAKNIIWSGVAGPTTGGCKWVVNLNGHANPGFKPKSGYSNDFVTVSVVQAVEGTPQ